MNNAVCIYIPYNTDDSTPPLNNTPHYKSTTGGNIYFCCACLPSLYYLGCVRYHTPPRYKSTPGGEIFKSRKAYTWMCFHLCYQQQYLHSLSESNEE